VSNKPKDSAGSLERVVLPRLIAEWRHKAEMAANELGSAIDAASRAQLQHEELMYKVCARQLEKAIKRQNRDVGHS